MQGTSRAGTSVSTAARCWDGVFSACHFFSPRLWLRLESWSPDRWPHSQHCGCGRWAWPRRWPLQSGVLTYKWTDELACGEWLGDSNPERVVWITALSCVQENEQTLCILLPLFASEPCSAGLGAAERPFRPLHLGAEKEPQVAGVCVWRAAQLSRQGGDRLA